MLTGEALESRVRELREQGLENEAIAVSIFLDYPDTSTSEMAQTLGVKDIHAVRLERRRQTQDQGGWRRRRAATGGAPQAAACHLCYKSRDHQAAAPVPW